MISMVGESFEDRITGLEIDVQSIKILIGSVDNKVERARLEVQHAQGANTRMIQALHDDLSEFRGDVKARFTDMGERFDAVEDRFITMDERLAAVDERFVAVDERFVAVDERFDRVDRRLDLMDARIDARFDEVLALIRETAGGAARA
ncbi:hypothetical protein [Microbispora sp. ATCC PTA-5024]|uniref:hypothetical protein n=1 Tax=Microbispora sp. ATCC PTA-5024 TaxID=316330 RepID=UPI0003DDA43A|nr:hypothetical protein [Microbispora sp. ATCC PTA-5024]ETK35788.1 hypothetical protein MPTA5024_12470 [Microbispora sp. ATCC PTA-5024]